MYKYYYTSNILEKNKICKKNYENEKTTIQIILPSYTGIPSYIVNVAYTEALLIHWQRIIYYIMITPYKVRIVYRSIAIFFRLILNFFRKQIIQIFMNFF